ncbi:MAG TPA: DNA polymerase III subunit gamma/tau [Xanthomonadaceae bacterium]|nr:DNA polymerase III subunit gamma/tau [Xanthomonadaceae bacterium]
MSYLVLARKWRPKRFAELVGQEHVVRALTNALDTGRVHHAFLFTGTRGVGKTTIARIFAKSLNCERGTSAEPCGECNACRDIDAGRFVDLLEIDAASNTGVDNVRDLIDNAQYMPSRGRVKVYLIDEVHMLSKPAFNALLKTLEEPPGHVKFLLATTDPQKLPVTVLSRCLQFNLKRLDEGQISGQITRILEAEDIPADEGAVRLLTRAADGSLRDGLSLLDQAIAYAGGRLDEATVAAMLGSVDRTRVDALLLALADGDGDALLGEVEALAEFSPDWGAVLEALAATLHRVQVRQLVPRAGGGDDDSLDALAGRLRPEVVQLWYQMALSGRRDLPLAPGPRAGFEMSLLWMLAFRPAEGATAGAAGAAPAAKPAPRGRGDAAAAARAALAGAAPANTAPPNTAPTNTAPVPSVPVAGTPADNTPASGTSAADAPRRIVAGNEDWIGLVAGGGLSGPVLQLASHAAFVGDDGDTLRLGLAPADELLRRPALVAQLGEALAPLLGGQPTVRVDTMAAGETPRQRTERERDARQLAAEEAFASDPQVRQLISQHGAKVVPDSIRPFDDA